MEFEQIKRVSNERHCGLWGLDDDIKDLFYSVFFYWLAYKLTHEFSIGYLQRVYFAELIMWFQTRIHVLSSRMSRASCGGFGWFDSGWMVRKDKGVKERERKRDGFNWSAWAFYYFAHAHTHTHKQHISHFPFIAYNHVARLSPSLDSTHTLKSSHKALRKKSLLTAIRFKAQLIWHYLDLEVFLCPRLPFFKE